MRMLLAAGAVFAAVFGGGLWLSRPLEPALAVETAVSVAWVIDGDTFVLEDGDRVRILNIDAAEMPPRAQCERERQLAVAAKARLGVLLENGGQITLARQGRDRDRYDRLLRKVRVSGRDVGEQLVAEGLAQPWEGHKATWC